MSSDTGVDVGVRRPDTLRALRVGDRSNGPASSRGSYG
jgi:hypothetical protein